MKKSIFVLLIAVLVAGFAFAGTLKGNAALEFNVDLQPTGATGSRSWGFANTKELKYSFFFEYDSTAVEVKGETNMWAELAISASASIKVTNSNPASPVTGKYTVKLSKANIHIGEDLTFGILSEGEGPDFAYSYYLNDNDVNDDYIYDDHEAEKIGGFTVTYKEWFGGFGAKGTWATDPAQFTFYGHGATPEFKFAEDQIIVQAGGYAAYANNTNVFARASFVGAGAKAEYAADKLNAYVGADVRYDDGVVGYEALAQASFAFAEEGKVGADAYVVDGKSVPALHTGDEEKVPLLDARVWAEYTLAASDDIEVSLYAEADARDILIGSREIVFYAEESTAIKGFGIALNETFCFFEKYLELNAKVDYTAEKFYAWTEVGAGFAFGSDPALVKLPFKCGISSTAIIDKAEIGLKYTRADFAKVGDAIKDAGLVTAYVKIGFDSTPAE